jgi:hypothetical protein
MAFLRSYVEGTLAKQVARIDSTTPLFWSTSGKRCTGKTSAPMTGKEYLAAPQGPRPDARLPGTQAA